MGIPTQNFDVRSDSLGVTESSDERPLYLGISNTGDIEVLKTWSRIADVVDEMDQGALSEDLCYHIANVGGPVLAMKMRSTVAPTIGSVTVSRVGTSTGTLAATATQQNAAQAWQIDDPAGTPVYVDETADFASAAANDVDPWPATEAAGDQFAVAYGQPFDKIAMTVGTVGVGGTLAVKYWNGTAWAAVSGLSDATTGFTVGGANDITWTMPTDWTPLSINGSESIYYVVFEVATIYGTDPVLTQGFIDNQGPYDDYEVLVEITKDGTVAVGEFKYSLDGGTTYSSELVIPSGGIYDIPNTGLTLTFTPGAGADYFDDGDVFAFDCIGPYFDAVSLAAAAAILVAASDEWDYIVFSGTAADAATAATLFAAIDTHMSTLETNFVFEGAIFDVGSADTAANVKTSMAAQTSDRINAVYGKVPMTTAKPITGWSTPNRPGTAGLGAQAVKVGLSGDLKRVAAGPLDNIGTPAHDERTATTTLDDQRITTFRTWRGLNGTYVTQGRIKSSPISDYRLWPHRRVMDRACKVVYENQLSFIGANPRLNSDATIAAGQPGAPGTIYEIDAKGLENPVKRQLRVNLTQPQNADGQQGHVSDFSYIIDRTTDVGTSKAIDSELKMVPLGYIDDVNTVLSYSFSL